jgi:hypothetical protein
MNIALSVLAVLLFTLWRLSARDARKAQVRADAEEAAKLKAVRDMHRAINEAMGGYPLVKWNHPSPTPTSDKWYYKARFAGRVYLFTEEAVRVAGERASLLLDHKR